jgi:ABC transporter substrate binding protein
MRRLALACLALACLALACFSAPLAAEAQGAAKVLRVGWLHPQSLPDQWVEGFRQGLREHGYVEGHDLIIERRWGDGRFDRLPAMAADLVRLNVDVVIAGNSAALRALQGATRTIPVVMVGVNDPVALGFIASLARPGGNFTGMSGLGPPLSGKRLELLREVAPGLTRITDWRFRKHSSGDSAGTRSHRRVGLGAGAVDGGPAGGVGELAEAGSRGGNDLIHGVFFGLLLVGACLIRLYRGETSWWWAVLFGCLWPT